MAETPSSSNARKVSQITKTASTPDVMQLAPSTSTADKTPGVPVTSTPLSTSTVDKTPEMPVTSTPESTRIAEKAPEAPVSGTPASISNAETSIVTTPGSPFLEILSPVKKGKRKRNESTWKKNVFKVARNCGKEYQSHSKNPEKRVRGGKKTKPPCKDKYRLKCSGIIAEEKRKIIFDSYWNLWDVAKQREFIHNSTTEIKPQYRYVREGGQRPRRNNNYAFYFNCGGSRIRVCKLFFQKHVRYQ